MPPQTQSTSCTPPSSNQGQAEYLSPPHAPILSLIGTIGSYVVFQFQRKKVSLFDEQHAIITKTIFVVLFLYAVGMMAELRLQNQTTYYLPTIKWVIPLIGLLVVVLLLLILSFPLGLVASIVWALLVVATLTAKIWSQEIGHQWLLARILHPRTSDSSGIQENCSPVATPPLENLPA